MGVSVIRVEKVREPQRRWNAFNEKKKKSKEGIQGFVLSSITKAYPEQQWVS